MRVAGVYIVVQNRLNQVLLCRRADIPLWVFPGGHVEKYETPKDAALREFYEETGFKIKVEKTIACYKNFTSGTRKYLFLGQIIGGKAALSEETTALKWVDLNRLPAPMTKYERNKIEDFVSYRTKLITREDKINIAREVLIQMKNPAVFVYLLYRFIKFTAFRKGEFKLKI